jgi:hypothetical protein
MQRRVVWVVWPLALALMGCGGDGDTGQRASPTTTTLETHSISGSVTIRADPLDTETDGVVILGDTCSGTSGYDDLEEGAQVVVTDEANKVIGNSSLQEGNPSGDDCIFRFVVPLVPRAKFYGIEVSHRGKVTYSHDNLVSQNWTVDLSID